MRAPAVSERAPRRRRPNAPLIVLFGVLVFVWGAVVAWLTLVFYVLGGTWSEWVYALDPRQHVTDFWFSFCLEIITPITILGGLTLAYLGRWRAALLVIPAAVLIDTVGGVIVYAVDQLFL